MKAVRQPFEGSLLIVPEDEGPHPGILILHGSESGAFPAWKFEAYKWASRGYAALAYSYFGSDKSLLSGPRPTLANIRIESVIEAFHWFKKSTFVAGKKAALEGFSRGAELALLATALGEEKIVDALSLHAPPSSVWGPWNFDWVDGRCWLGEAPSFEQILEGAPQFQWNKKCGIDPRNLPEELKYAWTWKGSAILPFEPIPIEKIKCPVFISEGMKGSVWPSEQAVEVQKRLLDAGTKCEVAFYEDEDHGLSLAASADRDRRIVRFFNDHLLDPNY